MKSEKLIAQDMVLSRRNLLRSAGLIGAAGAMPMGVARAVAAQGAASRFPLVAAELDEYVNDKKVAGMLAAIGFGTDAPEYVAAGTQNVGGTVAVNKDTLWRVYSMTKPVTGMAAMILIGEGKLKLDQPVAEILPEFAEMKVLTDPENSLDAVPAKNLMTIRHLLTHTAGLGYNIVTKGPLLDEYNRLGIAPGEVSKTPLPGFPVPAPTPSIDEFSRRVASLPLVAEPGTLWSYSISLDLLGYVIQQASGIEFGTFLQQKLFDPLGMTSTWFTVPESELYRLPTNYATLGGVLIPVDPPNNSIYAEPPAFPFGGAGMVSSARDYDRFLAMLVGRGSLDGKRIMSEETAMLGMSNLLPDTAVTKGTWVEGEGYGAGGRVGIGNEKAPVGTYGWGGAAGTVAFVDTNRNFRASGYTQYMPADAYPFQREFPKLIYKQMAALGAA
ncbi:MAG: serine hydrolase domain-containing protein [Pseudomonadota bacterium]